MVVYLLIIEDVKGRSTFIHSAYQDIEKAEEARRVVSNDEDDVNYGDYVYIKVIEVVE